MTALLIDATQPWWAASLALWKDGPARFISSRPMPNFLLGQPPPPPEPGAFWAIRDAVRAHERRQARQREDRARRIAQRYELYRLRHPELSVLQVEACVARDEGASVWEVGVARHDYRWVREAG